MEIAKTMQKIFWVKNGELDEVNKELMHGGKVKSITAVSETISSYGYAGGDTNDSGQGWNEGDIYAYVVIEYD